MKKSTVFIKGGFGNQLFQLSFAHFLKQNKFKVDINTKFLKDDGYNTPRRLILPLDLFGFKEQNFISKNIFNIFERINRSNKFKKTFSFMSDYKFSTDKENIFTENKNRYFFNGYWKDLNYINPTKEIIIESLSKNLIIKNGFEESYDNKTALIHVRRGDFLRDERQLNISYYEKSLDYMRSQNINKLHVFTDDKDWVLNQKLFESVEKIVSQKSGNEKKFVERGINSIDDKEETIKTFSSMLKYNNFVLSNSSFSFWAAFLKSTIKSKVTIPDPMFRNEERKNIYLENWKLIINE